jgi:hypothetical protein
MSIASAVAAVKKNFAPADQTTPLAARLAGIEGEIASTEADMKKAEADVFAFEKALDVSSANKAALRADDAGSKLARLRQRKSAITAAFNEERLAKIASDKAERVEAGRAVLAQATKTADDATARAVAQLVTLSKALEDFHEAGTAERLAHSALALEGDAPHTPPRYLGTVEDSAARQIGTHLTHPVRVPTK